MIICLLPAMAKGSLIFTQDGQRSGAMVESNPINLAAALLERIVTTVALQGLCIAGDGSLFLSYSSSANEVWRYTETDGLAITGATQDTPNTIQCTATGAWIPPFNFNTFEFAGLLITSDAVLLQYRRFFHLWHFPSFLSFSFFL